MNVAVAVITDALKQRVLITKRNTSSLQGGLWEFPGGKLEKGEAPVDALIREIQEELGLTVVNYRFLGQINHTYPDYHVSLWIYHVLDHQGDAYCRESQAGLCWADIDKLDQYEFPKANQPIFALLKGIGD